jgi:HSP20 family protein
MDDALRYSGRRNSEAPSVVNHWHELRIIGLRDHPEAKTMGPQPWSSATELVKLERDFEETLDHFLCHDWGVAKHAQGHHAPAIESFIHGDQLVIRAELPGIDPKDVDITVDGSLLTIRASREAEAEHEGRNFVHREIRYGSFARAISIPKGVRKEDIVAAWRHGVLELSIPLPKDAAVRRVPVEKSPSRDEPEGSG